jgi:hypothetical protein
MKTIEARMKLDYEKDHYTNGDTSSQTSYVNDRVIPVTAQSSECRFDIVF